MKPISKSVKMRRRRSADRPQQHESALISACAFIRDFQEMEMQLANGVSCPVERMIVELAMTPSNLRSREKTAGMRFGWFASLYAAMERHDLVPTSKSWDLWLQTYCERKEDALRRLSSLKITRIHPADSKYEAALDGIVGLFPPSAADRILIDYFLRRTLRGNSDIAARLAKKLKRRSMHT
jgi:hypothetical protein